MAPLVSLYSDQRKYRCAEKVKDLTEAEILFMLEQSDRRQPSVEGFGAGQRSRKLGGSKSAP